MKREEMTLKDWFGDDKRWEKTFGVPLDTKLGMDNIFNKMFGEKYGRSFFIEMSPDIPIEFLSHPELYADNENAVENKKECISEALLNWIEYLKNQNTNWYD